MLLQELLLELHKEISSYHSCYIKAPFIFKVLLLVYEGLNGQAPAYISELLHHRTTFLFTKIPEHPNDISEDVWRQNFFRCRSQTVE